MGFAKAMIFGAFAMFPGMILALIGWHIIGKPDEWGNLQIVACYGPFFGSIVVGIWLGMKNDLDVELET
ncbi:MAG: hypothetical protein QF454_06245 [Candidatus Thalassarchaeaceae archaeon]|nr:hypothetical protein [Candidatus Thalassarchaeaceae archaeon]